MRPISKKLVFLLILGLLVINYETEAQVRRGTFIPYSSAGFGIGTSSYYGDMASYTTPLRSTFGMMRWSITGNYTRHFTPRLAARASFTYARIVGDDYEMNKKDPTNIRFPRNLSFRNDLKEFAVVGIYKLTPDNRSYDRRPQFGAYLFGGIAAVAHNPKAKDEVTGDWVKLQSLGTEGQGQPGYAKPYSLIQMAIPIGIGVRYKINDRFDIGAELGFRFTFTDYLDDVSGVYADPSVFQPGSTGEKFSNRSREQFSTRKGKDRTAGLIEYVKAAYNIDTTDPYSVLEGQNYGRAGNERGFNVKGNDNYMTGTISVHYIIPSQVKCPPLK
ncbi:hypothetical protein SAMN04487995_5237 [Dyadobacter koreensis]|uniref:DUF6089 domain-containing protein n=1 Tax=Dyadobacter koreensis TaxID=408657 RepID=A0A1H6ZNE7_9BACT|nr:DUF6089 family protein [Dyadobacter koreensis]SEJ55023.1 hypothetical protein SAMN04487995_5237 [Dyadobacter koreensis]